MLPNNNRNISRFSAGRHATLWRSLAVLAAACSSVASAADDWRWSLTPYLWAISTDFSTALNLGDGGQQDFSDILGKLDFAAQVHAEAARDRWGFILDVTNLQMSDRGPQRGFEVKTDSKVTLVEALGMISAGEDARNGLDLLFGARILGVDLDVLVFDGEGGDMLARASLDDDLTDFVLGVRYRRALGDKWSLIARIDGASGDTDYTANLELTLGRHFGDNGALRIGYRYLDIEFERGSELLEPSLVISGPVIGYTFAF